MGYSESVFGVQNPKNRRNKPEWLSLGEMAANSNICETPRKAQRLISERIFHVLNELTNSRAFVEWPPTQTIRAERW